MGQRLRACWRLLCAVLAVMRGMWIVATQFKHLDAAQRDAHVKAWSQRMLAHLGLSLQAHGSYDASAKLIVANHVSWLDILVINAVQPASFVGKSDLRDWPILGWLIANTGTIFIERYRPKDVVRVVHYLAAQLQAGKLIAIFPEGTTADGHQLLPFHANLLQAAITAGTPVQAIALRYSDAREAISSAAAYVGDTHLGESLWRIVCARQLTVNLSFLPAQTSELERRELAQVLQARVQARLQQLTRV